MDIIIVCHTEFGFVYNKRVIYDKKAIDGVEKGVINLNKVVDKYQAKVTYAIMPEVMKYFPKNIDHELGLHIHPGFVNLDDFKGNKLYIGDSYLKEHCNQSINSTILQDYSYKEQLEMIKTGKDFHQDVFGVEPNSFVAGRWSVNNDTIKALIQVGITHDCSAITSSKSDHYDWSKLPRICMPYHPSSSDYQSKGNLPILIVPISHLYGDGNANPEVISSVGLSFLKACFLEYYKQKLPLFHICLHSPCMTDDYFISATNEIIKFISNHKNINFKFASEINEYNHVDSKTKILPYLFAINRHAMRTYANEIKTRISGETR